jgi:hypothetical protein
MVIIQIVRSDQCFKDVQYIAGEQAIFSKFHLILYRGKNYKYCDIGVFGITCNK